MTKKNKKMVVQANLVNLDTDNWYSREITITGPVKFVGDPKDDPENNLGFQIWKKAFLHVYKDGCV
jgi:hypothetical protein